MSTVPEPTEEETAELLLGDQSDSNQDGPDEIWPDEEIEQVTSDDDPLGEAD